MWDVFPNDMVLDNSVELALANLDLNDPVLEPITFDDGDTLEGSSSTLANVEITLDTKEKDAAEESSGDHDDEYNDSWATYCLDACSCFVFAISIFHWHCYHLCNTF